MANNSVQYESYIRELQGYLSDLALNDKRIPVVSIDGKFGTKTAEAVKAFQALYSIPQTGYVDNKTWDLIVSEHIMQTYRKAAPMPVNSLKSQNPVIKFGDNGDAVYNLQLMLNAFSKVYCNIPPIEINGIYDEKTEKAVTVIKKIIGSKSHGVDKPTWDKIAHAYNTIL